MKDAKGHGSNPRGKHSPAVYERAADFEAQRLTRMPQRADHPRGAHTSGIDAAMADDGVRHARPTGFPVGGWYALHPVTGETLKKPNAQYGDLPPRFATEDKAHAYAMKVTRK